MKFPAIHGVIQRRILLNYRVDPELLATLTPPPFRPVQVKGYGIVGVCLIRLAELRPPFWPLALGLVSENVALRAAVEWTRDDAIQQGVYILRRDTDSRLNALCGGRLFPGVQHLARFQVQETAERFEIDIASRDGVMDLSLRARLATEFPQTSVFGSQDRAVRFFQHGSLGYSESSTSGRYDGLELHCEQWPVDPLAVEEVHSSFFDNLDRFPPGSIELDCALLMRNIAHTWRRQEELCCDVRPIPQPAPQASAM